MIEELKDLETGEILTFTDEQIFDFTGSEELEVSAVQVFSHDDNEIVIVEMGDYFLVAHNFESEEKVFIYQLVDEGDIIDLEENGYKILNEDDDFGGKIVIREDGKAHIYRHSDTGAIYSLTVERDDYENDEPEDVAFCEFYSSTNELGNILIKNFDNYIHILQGFEIEENSFEFSDTELD